MSIEGKVLIIEADTDRGNELCSGVQQLLAFVDDVVFCNLYYIFHSVLTTS